MNFAKVRFSLDQKLQTVPISAIQKFVPERMSKFTTYYVQRDIRKDNFLKATIVVLGESEEDVDQKMAELERTKKRLTHVPTRYLQSVSTGRKSKEKKGKENVRKQKFTRTENVSKRLFVDKTNEDDEQRVNENDEILQKNRQSNESSALSKNGDNNDENKQKKEQEDFEKQLYQVTPTLKIHENESTVSSFRKQSIDNNYNNGNHVFTPAVTKSKENTFPQTTNEQLTSPAETGRPSVPLHSNKSVGTLSSTRSQRRNRSRTRSLIRTPSSTRNQSRSRSQGRSTRTPSSTRSQRRSRSRGRSTRTPSSTRSQRRSRSRGRSARTPSSTRSQRRSRSRGRSARTPSLNRSQRRSRSRSRSARTPSSTRSQRRSRSRGRSARTPSFNRSQRRSRSRGRSARTPNLNRSQRRSLSRAQTPRDPRASRSPRRSRSRRRYPRGPRASRSPRRSRSRRRSPRGPRALRSPRRHQSPIDNQNGQDGQLANNEAARGNEAIQILSVRDGRVYLGHNKWIRVIVWNLTQGQPPSKIVRAILKSLHGDRILINRSVNQGRCQFQARNMPPRRQFTSQELDHIGEIYFAVLSRRRNVDVGREMKRLKEYISKYIGDIQKKYRHNPDYFYENRTPEEEVYEYLTGRVLANL